LSDRLIVRVDATVLNTMDSCPEKWRLQFYENWQPQKKAIALERGILMHQMLEHYHVERMKGRNKPADMPLLIEECLMVGRIFASNSANIDSSEFQEDMRVFKEYFQRWQYDSWEILAVEKPFSVPLYESPKLLILYEGIVDLIARDPTMGLIIVDNKTESRKSEPFILSNQFEGYQWASPKLSRKINPDQLQLPLIVNKIGYQQNAKMESEGEWDGLRQKKVDTRFRRLVMQSNPDALAEWREDAIRLVIDSIGWAKDIEAGKRVRKNRTSCDKYAGCMYQMVCKEPVEVREHKLTVNFFKDKPWDVFERDAVVERNPAIHDEASTF